MPQAKDLAICLKHWDWSETSQTVSILTRGHGVVRAVAKGSKNDPARFSGGIDLGCLAECSFIAKGTDALAILTSWDLREVFHALRRSRRAFHAGMAALDLARHAIHERDPHPESFDALLACLRSLGGDEPPARVLCRFLLVLLDDAGHRPELDTDVETGEPLPAAGTLGFSPHRGGITRRGAEITPRGGASQPVWGVRGETIGFLRALRAGGERPGFSDQTADRALRLLASYFREAFQADPPALSGYLALDEARSALEGH